MWLKFIELQNRKSTQIHYIGQCCCSCPSSRTSILSKTDSHCQKTPFQAMSPVLMGNSNTTSLPVSFL